MAERGLEIPLPARGGGCAGFTLLEMLVTLVIVAATVAILSQALWQVYRIETLLSGSQLQGQTALVRGEWVRQALAALQTGDASGQGRLQGAARALTGVTGNPLSSAGGAFGPLELSLHFDPAAGETALLARMAEGGRDAPIEILRWAGDVGRFMYLDESGTAHDAWPPALGKQRPLPRAIVLETGLEGMRVLAVTILTNETSMLTRLELEKN